MNSRRKHHTSWALKGIYMYELCLNNKDNKTYYEKKISKQMKIILENNFFSFQKNFLDSHFKKDAWASFVVQWLRKHLAIQGTTAIYIFFFNSNIFGPGKILHATGQLSPCATVVEPVLWSQEPQLVSLNAQLLKPMAKTVLYNWRVAPAHHN